MNDETLLHAIDLAILGEWEAAKEQLRAIEGGISSRLTELIVRQQARESEQARSSALARHEIGNALSIARANIEGMADGILDVSQQRLNGIAAALASAGLLLTDGVNDDHGQRAHVDAGDETTPVKQLIGDQVAMVKRIAQAKNVVVEDDVAEKDSTFHGDVHRAGRLLRNVLLNAVRLTPPGGGVRLLTYDPASELTLSIVNPDREAASVEAIPVAQAVAPNSHVVNSSPKAVTILVQFP